MPTRSDLPESLAGLARRNALPIRHDSFRSDTGRLITAIEPVLAAPYPCRRLDQPDGVEKALEGRSATREGWVFETDLDLSSRASPVATAWPNHSRLTSSLAVYPALLPPPRMVRCGSAGASSTGVKDARRGPARLRQGPVRPRGCAGHVNPDGRGRHGGQHVRSCHHLANLTRAGKHRDEDIGASGYLRERGMPLRPRIA